MRIRTPFITGCAVVTLTAMVWSQGRGNPNDWPTAFGDAQHTSWMRTDINISIESMSQPGFALQWKAKLDIPARPAESLTSGVVTPSVNIFTPISTIAGPGNTMFALDNDTGNVFWTRRFQGALPAATPACAGGISGAPTRVVNLVTPLGAPARGGAARGARAYSSAVGEPGEGVPLPATGGGRGGAGGGGAAGGRGAAAPVAPAQPAPGAPEGQAAAGQRGRGQGAPALPPSPFPTNPAAQGSGGIWAPSGTIYTVTADGMFRRLGLVSGKDMQRPVRFLPAGAKFSDLIAVGDMAYTATSGSCGGAPNGIWAVHISGDPNTVVSWQTNGGDPIGSVAFSTSGTLIAAIAPGMPAAGGHANAIVALDPKSLTLKDWFRQPGVEFAAAPIVFQQGGRDIVAITTRDGRLLLLDADSLGGADHATPLFASVPLVSARSTFTAQSPATWEERTTPAAPAGPAQAAASSADGTRWLLVSVTGELAARSDVSTNGPITTGGILALKVSHVADAFSVHPSWMSENIAAPLTPIIVNGVVFASSAAPNSPAKLSALDGTTGKTSWESGTEMTAPISGRSLWTGSGHVFVGTRDGTVYAFGFDMERGTSRQRASWR